MFYLNWRLTTFAFVVMPFIAIIIAYVTRRFRRISVRIQDSVTNVTEAVDEAVLGHRIVKIYNGQRSEEHTSELQSLMRISYAVFCLKKKKQQHHTQSTHNIHKQGTLQT